MKDFKRGVRKILNKILHWLGIAQMKIFLVLAWALPKSFVLFMKNDFKVRVRLDYARKDILIRVESRADIGRARCCGKEPGTVKWIEDNIKKDSVFYDIGANIGAFSLLASKIAEDRVRVYAFEPSFSTFRHLVFNILENHCQENISLFMLPLSAKSGKNVFNYYSIDPGTSLHMLGQNLNLGEDRRHSVLASPIIGYSIDDLVDVYGFEPPTHMKLDVDGLEYDILCGARRQLEKKTVQSLIVEMGKNNPRSQLIFKLLSDFGYQRKETYYHVYHENKLFGKSYTDDTFYDCVFEP